MPIYPAINGSLMNGDLTYIFSYVDLVTKGLGSSLICLSFFLVVFLSSLTFQQKTTGQMKLPSSLLAGAFVTTGFELIMMQKNLINGYTFGITLAITLLAFLWVAMSDSEQPGM